MSDCRKCQESQAREAALREAMDHYPSQCIPETADPEAPCVLCRALSTPTDDSALRKERARVRSEGIQFAGEQIALALEAGDGPANKKLIPDWVRWHTRIDGEAKENIGKVVREAQAQAEEKGGL